MKVVLGVLLAVSVSLILLLVRPLGPQGNAFERPQKLAETPAPASPPPAQPLAKTSHVFAAHWRLLERSGDQQTFVHSDPLESVLATTAEDGTDIYQAVYLPFGAPAHSQGIQKYGFAGKELDGTATQYFGARSYIPAVGRFIQADPVFTSAVSPYVYASQNPFRFKDPGGRREESADEVRLGGDAVTLLLDFAPRTQDFVVSHQEFQESLKQLSSQVYELTNLAFETGQKGQLGFDIKTIYIYVLLAPDFVDSYVGAVHQGAESRHALERHLLGTTTGGLVQELEGAIATAGYSGVDVKGRYETITDQRTSVPYLTLNLLLVGRADHVFTYSAPPGAGLGSDLFPRLRHEPGEQAYWLRGFLEKERVFNGPRADLQARIDLLMWEMKQLEADFDRHIASVDSFARAYESTRRQPGFFTRAWDWAKSQFGH